MRPMVIGYSRRMRLPSTTPQPAAFRAGSMCSARVSASFMMRRGLSFAGRNRNSPDPNINRDDPLRRGYEVVSPRIAYPDFDPCFVSPLLPQPAVWPYRLQSRIGQKTVHGLLLGRVSADEALA